MKKKLLSILSLLTLYFGSIAQTNIANYTYTASTGAYTPLTGATTFTNAWDDMVSAAIPLGGTFTFGGTAYTTCFINSNGYITFGTAASSTGYTPISTTGVAGVVSAFGCDGASSTMAAAVPLISYMNVGSEFVVEYKDHATYGGSASEMVNFQIRLNLTTNQIKIVYGNCTVPTSGYTPQVGIRGNSTTWASNVNNLLVGNVPAATTCGWLNAVTNNASTGGLLYNPSNTNVIPVNGLTFAWDAPLAAVAPVRVFSAVTGIATTSAVVAWTAPAGATQYNVQYRIPGSCTWTNFSGNPVSVANASLTGLTPSTIYQVRVQSSNGTNNAIWSHIPNAAGTGNGYVAAGTFSTLTNACTGMPSAGTVPASFSICPNTTAIITNTSSNTGAGITYTWMQAPSATGPFTNVSTGSGFNTQVLTTASLTSQTFYQLVVTCTNSSQSATTAVMSVNPNNPVTMCYCNQSLGGSSCSGDNITNVTIIGTPLNNNSTCTTTPTNGTYSQFQPGPTTTATLNAAQSYSISVNTTVSNIESVWIDYNQNGIFDASEHTQITTSSTANVATIAIINIPANALAGLTGMRVRSRGVGNANGPTDACTNFGSGETEDYYVTIVSAPLCSGAPAANTALTSASVVCPGGTANLSLATTYTTIGLTYQWFSAPAVSGPYTSITNATTTAYTATNITVNTFYQAVITCTNGPASTTSTPVQVAITTNPCQCNAYCASNATNVNDDEIFNVSIGTLNNTSACGQTGGPGSTLSLYSNYTGMLAAPNLTVGSTYTISVTVGQCNGNPYSGGVTVYMDFNNNGSFSDAGEQVYASASTLWAVTGTTLSAPITIPANATIGITRMRVIAAESNTSYTACGTYGYGETEDYCINLAAAPTCTAASGGTLNATSISACNGATVNVSSTGATVGSGIVYQWMVSSTPSGPYSNVVGGSGATGLSYTTAALSTGTYYYVLQTTCTTATLTGISNEGTVTINPIPNVTASPSSTTICVPGSSSVTLNGSGASTYTWSPAASLSNSVGTSVSALPNTTTAYTVIGTSAAGCTNVATATVNVNIGLVVDSVAINPATICAGSNATLMAYAANPAFTYCQATYATGTSFGDYISSVILGSLTNTSVGSASPYYTFYPQSLTTTTLTAGNTYTISLVAGTYGTNDIAAFIDYNQNGSLIDAGEKLGEVDNFGAAPASVDIVFTVPATATNGKVRLRVRELDHSTTNDIDPCLVQSSFGETEDYVVTIVGGVNPPFTYAWSPATFLSSTSTASTVANAANLTTAYTVSVSNAAGCSATGAKTLSVNPLPVVSVTGNTAICTGNTAVLTATGATTYSWNTTASTSTISVSPVTPTTYSVIGTNSNNCSNTATFALTVNATPTLVLGASQSSVCAGSTVNIGVTGATNYTWSTGSNSVSINPTVSATTNYSVIGSTNGCTGTSSVTITANANPTVSATSSASLICNGSPAVLTATGASTYSWNTSATTASISVTPSTTTSYTVTGTTNGCSNTFVISQAVSGCVGIDTKVASASGILVYPNPNTGEFTIELNNGSVKNIDVMDLTGRVIVSNTSANDKVDFNINTLANGIYYVRIQTNNTVEVIKIVKQ